MCEAASAGERVQREHAFKYVSLCAYAQQAFSYACVLKEVRGGMQN